MKLGDNFQLDSEQEGLDARLESIDITNPGNH